MILLALVALSVAPVFADDNAADDHAIERVSVTQANGSSESDGVELGDSTDRVIEVFGEPETQRTIFEGESSDGDLLALEWDGVEVQYFRGEDRELHGSPQGYVCTIGGDYDQLGRAVGSRNTR